MTFTLRPDNLSAFLQADEVIDFDRPAINARSREITANLVLEVDIAKALFDWVRDFIPHSADAGREEVTCSASQVLASGTGICYAKAHLLAALLRCKGIPAGFCYQVYHEELHFSENRLALHGLNGVYLQNLGRWIRVDSRGNKTGVDAQFNVDREQLAFPENEFLDRCIYARPLPQVIQALTFWPTCSLLWPHLPAPTAGS